MADVLEGLYDVGTVSIANGSDQLLGTGTFWLAAGERFDEVYVAGQRVLVKSIDMDGVATLAMPWDQADVVDAPYVWSFRSQLRIDPTQTQAKIRDLITFYKMGGVRGTREVTDAAAAVVVDDLNKAIVFKRAGGIAVSIAEAGASGQFVDGWATTLKNSGTGLVTITPDAGAINEQPYLELPSGAGAFLWSHGGDYYALVFTNLDGADGGSIFIQPAAPGTGYAAGSIWIDSDSATLDLYNLIGEPLAWTDTGVDLRGLPGSNGIDGASAFTVVRVVATANVTIASALENGDALNGVTLATGDLVLLAGQTSPAENGVYVVAEAGAASRHASFNTYDAHCGRYFSVMEGAPKPDTLWRCTSNKGGTLGSTAIVISEFTSGGGREMLLANRTYYVDDALGSDVNDGLAAGVGRAFKTGQKAIDAAALLDCSIYDVTISVAAGTYAPIVLKTFLGAGKITIRGDVATPANVVIASVAADGVSGSNVIGRYKIEGFKFTNATSGSHIRLFSTYLELGANEYGAATTAHIWLEQNAYVEFLANYTISGGATRHLFSTTGGIIVCSAKTVTITGTPNFTTAFVVGSRTGVFNLPGNTYSGSATGIRYVASFGAQIDVAGGGASYLPGNAAGSTPTGGQYA